MKVRSLVHSKLATRGLVAVALAGALAAGAATPVAAHAEAASATTAPIAAAEPSTATAVPSVATSSVAGTATLASTTTVVSKTVRAARKAKKLTVPQLVAKIGHDNGLSNAEVGALLWVAKRESNFHPTSKSRSGCYGLFQLTKGMVSGHPWKDPKWNTKRAITYMKGRYHGVLKAKAFWLRHHWY